MEKQDPRRDLRKVESSTGTTAYFHQWSRLKGEIVAIVELDGGEVAAYRLNQIRFIDVRPEQPR